MTLFHAPFFYAYLCTVNERKRGFDRRSLTYWNKNDKNDGNGSEQESH